MWCAHRDVLPHCLILFLGELEAVPRTTWLSFHQILLQQSVPENRGVLCTRGTVSWGVRSAACFCERWEVQSPPPAVVLS